MGSKQTKMEFVRMVTGRCDPFMLEVLSDGKVELSENQILEEATEDQDAKVGYGVTHIFEDASDFRTFAAFCTSYARKLPKAAPDPEKPKRDRKPKPTADASPTPA